MALESGPPSSGRPGGEAVAGQVEKDTAAPDLPDGWPSDVVYLASHSMPVEGLPASLCLQLCTAPKPSHPSHPAQARARAWTEIRLVTAQTAFQPAYGSSLTTHPTLGQFGLFARRDIPPHTLVVPYLGHVHLASEEDASSRYDAAVESSDGIRLGIDATRAGNEARFVNDYRGILPRPNLFFQDWTARCPPLPVCEVPLPHKVKGLALFTGAHAVRAGTELCASYGKGWWAARAE